MPSFAWSTRFREGQWVAFRRFMLQERRDASMRFMVLEAEKRRIGSVRILYGRNDDGTVSERRVGVSVTPPGSSLSKLLQAYVAMGGNPFDISMFLGPGKAVGFDNTVYRTQPSDGVLAPEDVRYSYDVGASDGDVTLSKYKTSRVGGRRNTEKHMELLGLTSHARRWVHKEINFKRTTLEAKIIKLMDLREQYDEEVEQLLWATYGDMLGSPGYDPDRFTDSLAAGAVAYFFDSTFRVAEADGTVNYDDTADAGEPGSPNSQGLAGYAELISDLPDEDGSAL